MQETVYDEKGNVVKQITYNKDDPTSKLYSESKRDDNGIVTADVDESGRYNSAKYTYDHNGQLTVQADGKGNKTSFGYNNGELVSVSGSTDGEESTNTMQYTAGLLTKTSNGETEYNYTYDGWGRITKVEIAGNKYLDVAHESDLKSVTTLASGEQFATQTDKYGKTIYQIAIYTNGETESVVNEYDPETSRLRETTIDINGREAYNITYEYDKVNGKLSSFDRCGDYSLGKNNSYTAEGELQSTSYALDRQKLNYTYETDVALDKRSSKVVLPFEVEQNALCDGLGRTKQIALGKNLVKDIYYAKYGDHATNRVNSVWYGVNGIRKDNLKYAYDKAGNITTVTENGSVIARYVYDGLNRLVRENSVFGKITYQYDNAGNILCKTVDGKKYNYSYPASGWKDQLLAYNDETFEYDVLGNPIVYRDRTLAWQGRRLTSYAKDKNKNR